MVAFNRAEAIEKRVRVQEVRDIEGLWGACRREGRFRRLNSRVDIDRNADVEQALFRQLSTARLEDMLAAGEEVVRCMRVLAKSGDNIVSEVLQGQGDFYEWDHYPKGDVFDPETHAQYYYHAHQGTKTRGEHGHFHTFLRAPGMPSDVTPANDPMLSPPVEQEKALSHLIAIGMDSFGSPISLFTTNRWVTDETWHKGADVVRMLDYFEIELAKPSWPVNRWITAMVDFFRPQIEMLIEKRDNAVADWARSGVESVYEDRELEVISEIAVSVNTQLDHIHEALAKG